MRASLLAGLLATSSLIAGCESPGSVGDAPREVAAVAVDGRDDRIILNDGKALAAAQGDRIVITAMRSAMRTGNLDAYLRALSDTSCAKGLSSRAGEAVGLTATPTMLRPADPALRKVGQLTFVAGYELSSTDPRFGGLSGVEMLDDGNLLAVSDAGHFVWIDLMRDGLTPSGARISTMRDSGGMLLSGFAGDSAEGVAVNGGIALVSFEGNHRVLAFDLGKCGAAARGAPIVFDDYGLALDEAYAEARIAVDPGNGSEPLAVTQDWYVFAGIEKKFGHLNSLSARPIEAEPEFDLRVGVDAPELAGMDVLPGLKGGGSARAFLVHRGPGVTDGAVWITATDLHRFEPSIETQRPSRGEMEARARQRYAETGWRELAQLDQVGLVDDFEGIAARELSDGRVRLYIISDNDFLDTKRTVLMVFDLARPSR